MCSCVPEVAYILNCDVLGALEVDVSDYSCTFDVSALRDVYLTGAISASAFQTAMFMNAYKT